MQIFENMQNPILLACFFNFQMIDLKAITEHYLNGRSGTTVLHRIIKAITRMKRTNKVEYFWHSLNHALLRTENVGIHTQINRAFPHCFGHGGAGQEVSDMVDQQPFTSFELATIRSYFTPDELRDFMEILNTGKVLDIRWPGNTTGGRDEGKELELLERLSRQSRSAGIASGELSPKSRFIAAAIQGECPDCRSKDVNAIGR